jgi:ParB family chromosome partitioning protein
MSQETIQILPLEQISVDPQVRQEFDEPSLHGMALSMKEVDQLQPILVRRDGQRLVVVDGERRLRAAKRAGSKTVKAIIEERELSAADIIQRRLVANIQRQNFTPLETANALKELMKLTGWSASEVAARLGFSAAGVSRSLSLLSLPSPVAGYVQSGAIPASSAYQIAKVADPAKQTELAQKVVDQKLTREQATDLVRQATSPAPLVTPQVPIRLRFELGGGRWVEVSCTGFDDSILSLKESLAKIQRGRRLNIEICEYKKVLRREVRTGSSAR